MNKKKRVTKENKVLTLSCDNGKSILSPEEIRKTYPKISENLIISFFKDVIDELLFEKKIDYFFTVYGENDYTVYKFINEECCIVHSHVGASASTIIFEELIALGAKNIVFCGGAGSLKKEITCGSLVLVKSAIRDEGTSFQYLKRSPIISNNSSFYKEFRVFLKSKTIHFVEGRTWTTDGLYRETIKKRENMIRHGCIIVEMEQSALMAVSKYRNVNYASLIYAGDDISGDIWDSRKWCNRDDVRAAMCNLALEFLLKRQKNEQL